MYECTTERTVKPGRSFEEVRVDDAARRVRIS
jgi:hypothetical protein